MQCGSLHILLAGNHRNGSSPLYCHPCLMQLCPWLARQQAQRAQLDYSKAFYNTNPERWYKLQLSNNHIRGAFSLFHAIVRAITRIFYKWNGNN